ncbi:hypothetical protein [Actinosynnema pretiosum]|nr:hypothetical protein [Actinosynnema pretiosum]
MALAGMALIGAPSPLGRTAPGRAGVASVAEAGAEGRSGAPSTGAVLGLVLGSDAALSGRAEGFVVSTER